MEKVYLKIPVFIVNIYNGFSPFFHRIPDSIGKDIEKACQGIYPLHDVYIRKVKVLKKPKFDLGKLMEMHGEGGTKTVITESGEKVERPEGYEPPVLESV